MEERTDSPIAVKVEKHSNFVILTYFQGDINSMVDAHFNRALKKDYNPKESAAKTNKFCKAIKLEKTVGTCQTSAIDCYPESQASPMSERLLTITTANNTRGSWPTFPTRTGEGPGLPTISYSLSPDGLSLTGQQYASSLLNLLQSDRGEMGPIASSSKPELLPSWTIPQGFRESVDPAAAFEPGRHLEKKDLYWY